MKRVAALDLGSNTTLLLIADVADGRIVRVVHDETHVTKMGQGVHANRKFHPDALERVDACLEAYAETIRKSKCDVTVAVATSAARDVANGALLLEIGRAHGIPIRIIGGEQEAELTFHGALCDRSETQGLAVIDVGGGSTEVISRINGRPTGKSVDVGSVRLTEMFGTDFAATRSYVRNAFQKAMVPPKGLREIVGVAGTPTTLAAVEQAKPFSEEIINGYPLTVAKMEAWITKLAGMSVEEREKLPGMQPKRADVIVAGSIILSEALQFLGQDKLTVSTRGVRYGVALKWHELS